MAKKTGSIKQPKLPGDTFIQGDPTEKPSNARIEVLKNGLIFDQKRFEYKEDFVPAKSFLDVHTTSEMVEFLRKDKSIQLEARVLGMRNGSKAVVKMNRDQFLEAVKTRESKKMREGFDAWADDGGTSGWGGGGLIGRDFTPLLGGPFNKQLYYRDYLRMIATCFFAYHHDPVARALVNIMTDFTMGRGFTLHAKGKNENQAQLIWDAFAEANNFHEQMEQYTMEMSIYGETMWWKLPNNNARIVWQPGVNEKIPKALLPRIRLIDPSNIAEIITVPEDMVKGVLYYVWLAPTQYQMWTRDNQPSAKFIYSQIPANQIIHEKINAVSNEKRGRSDYFPALGFMKRLRDGIDYAVVAEQKAAAWCIDTTIEGDENDINMYIQDQNSQAAIPSAGSEFVHTAAVKREYLSNTAGKNSGDSPLFAWCLNMACMAQGIPVSYLGTHLSGAGNRASALVSTEPVAKKFERRRLVYERTIRRIFNWVMKEFGIEAECDIVFPELITQDRSTKLRDLTMAQTNSWISHKRAAEQAAKELDVKDYDYNTEQKEIVADDKALGISPAMMNPLTAPSAGGQNGSNPKSSAVTGPERNQIKNNLGNL